MASMITVVFASILIVQTISAQILGPGFRGTGNVFGGHGAGFPGFNGGAGIPPMNGGGFQVQSFSPLPANGISVVSENVIDGQLAVGGQLPLSGAVAVESQLPSSGSASVNYSCGNNQVGITQASGTGPSKGPASASLPN